jgi:hypothetical protein
MISRHDSDDVARRRRGLAIELGPHPLNRLVSALIGGGIGLVLGGAAASRVGIAENAVPWVAIVVALVTFLAFCAVFFLRRPKSPS